MTPQDRNELETIKIAVEAFKIAANDSFNTQKLNLTSGQERVFGYLKDNYYIARDSIFESIFSICDTVYSENPFLTRDMLERKGLMMINTEETCYPLESMFRNFVNGYDIERHILVGYTDSVYEGIEKVEHEYQT